MGLTLDIHHFVTWQFATAGLQELLQAGFWIFVGVDQCQAFDFGGQPGGDPLFSRFHAGIEVDRTDQRFEGVGQDRLTAETTALQLAGPQAQVFAQAETTGQHRQGLALYQARTQTRQLAFTGLRETLEQRFTGDKIEDGITEEFQALVIAPCKAAVCEGKDHQFLVLEGVAELTLETC
ncbi:hypothetical protein BHE74_00007139 [Ensete ventricosum]|nr:hypothetical protein BHE74_00007139 [Ensete ventricosum]